jgi:hypothetical protein
MGSATHLFQEGVTSYASSWLGSLSRLNAKFKNINLCPLIPFLRDNTPGDLARDIELLSFWLSRVYSGSIRGMGDVWSTLNLWVKQTSVGSVHLEGGEVVKIPLPRDLISPAVFTTFYKFTSTCPALIPKQDCTATSVLVRALCTSLLRDFSISINPTPEVILPRDPALMGGTKDTKVKHLVCIGSSIMSQAIPYLRALGYTVTDLTRPGWLATDENITALISAMSKVQIEGGFVAILDLLGNCTYRFTQFDGTLSLPFKESNKFHMGGEVTTCSDEVFKRILKSLSTVLLSAQDFTKIIIPPLPRYVFNTCCSNTAHCTNFRSENYAEKNLNGVTRLRGVLKKEVKEMGVKNYWILDGIGSVTGTPPGTSTGSNREALSELRSSLATDGVHLTPSGNRNLVHSIDLAIEGLRTGKLKKDQIVLPPTVTGAGQRTCKATEFYWRGFSSPKGDLIGRARSASGPQRSDLRGRQAAPHPHPYARRGR